MGQAAPPDLNRFVYPLAPRIECPPVTVDTTDLPEAQDWGDQAKGLVQNWFPQLCQLLATEDYKPPKSIRLIIKKKINVPAYASGGEITINGEWITKHPDDLGMVVHELTHVVQMYPDFEGKPGWLVEGIADYTRWWRYEPESPRSKINKEKANYTDSYRTTAYWLAFVGHKYDMRLVPALDRAMRHKEDPMPLFEKMTGKTPDALWKEFIESLP